MAGVSMTRSDQPARALRVMVLGNRVPDLFADNIRMGIEDSGHTALGVRTFPDLLYRGGRVIRPLREGLHLAPRLAHLVHRHILQMAEEFRPDLTLNVDYRLGYPVVRELRNVTGAPVVFWFPDSPGNLRRETHVLAGYDALFFKDSVLVERYRRTLELNAHFLPQACNPRWHRPLGELMGPTDPPRVLVAGNMYPTRFQLLRKLAAHGIELVIHGSPWSGWLPHAPELRARFSGRPVFGDEKARAFRSASVVLNSVVSFEGDGMNTRLFESAACGAVVLTEARARLGELFRVGEEVHSYTGFEELLGKLRTLAGLSLQERQAIGAAATRRAHRDHTYRQRFDEIVATLGRG